MPEQETIERAREDAREGKSTSTQAGEFVREEFHHIREGKHGARSPQQAIAIGLSKARRAGVPLRSPKRGSKKTRRQAARDSAKSRQRHKTVSRRRSLATLGALKREGRGAASTRAISRQVRNAARRRSSSARSASARKAARTRSPMKRSAKALKTVRRRSKTAVSSLRRKTAAMQRRTRTAARGLIHRRNRRHTILSVAVQKLARSWRLHHRR